MSPLLALGFFSYFGAFMGDSDYFYYSIFYNDCYEAGTTTA